MSLKRRGRFDRRLLGASTFAAIAMIGFGVIPETMQTYRLVSRQRAAEELAERLATSHRRLADLRSGEGELATELASLQNRGLIPEQTETLRNEWLEDIRRAGGSIRRFDIEVDEARRWHGEEDSVRQADAFLDSPSGFMLHAHHVTLHVEGDLETLKTILTDLRDRRMLAITESITIGPIEDNADRLALQLEMRVFGLGPDDGEIEDDYAAGRRGRRRSIASTRSRSVRLKIDRPMRRARMLGAMRDRSSVLGGSGHIGDITQC